MVSCGCQDFIMACDGAASGAMPETKKIHQSRGSLNVLRRGKSRNAFLVASWRKLPEYIYEMLSQIDVSRRHIPLLTP